MKSPPLPYLMLTLLTVVLVTARCTESSEGTTAQLAAARGEANPVAFNQEDIQKIDIHTHYIHSRDWLIPLLKDWNMRAVVVNVVTAEEARSPARPVWKAMLAHHRQHPERFLLCTSFGITNINDPSFAADVIAQLKEDIKDGAVMVKVWKNIGMVYNDEEGNYIQIDDPRLQPIWDFLAEKGIPVLAHIGEPRAAWLPLDPESPHYTYYKNHPQYHNYKNSNVPSWETIIGARDHWLEENPELIVIGAHLGSMAYDVSEVAERLDEYPNFYVDTAERFGDLVIQPSEKVREFFIEYQDRILYGTDLRSRTPGREMSEEELRQEQTGARKRLQLQWQYLTSADSMMFVRTGTTFKVETRGLNLPREVVRKFYLENAQRVLDL